MLTGNEPVSTGNLKSSLGRMYPVGSIYMSAVDSDPGALFGGTWERIEGRFLLAADANHAAGLEGGEESHVLANSEMPKHNHPFSYRRTGTGSSRYYLSSSAGLSYTASPDYTVTDSVGTSGGGEPHNNMPPYLAVYMWKRTA